MEYKCNFSWYKDEDFKFGLVEASHTQVITLLRTLLKCFLRLHENANRLKEVREESDAIMDSENSRRELKTRLQSRHRCSLLARRILQRDNYALQNKWFVAAVSVNLTSREIKLYLDGEPVSKNCFTEKETSFSLLRKFSVLGGRDKASNRGGDVQNCTIFGGSFDDVSVLQAYWDVVKKSCAHTRGTTKVQALFRGHAVRRNLTKNNQDYATFAKSAKYMNSGGANDSDSNSDSDSDSYMSDSDSDY